MEAERECCGERDRERGQTVIQFGQLGKVLGSKAVCRSFLIGMETNSSALCPGRGILSQSEGCWRK